MLLMLLLLAAAPQSAIPATPPALIPSPPNGAAMRVIGQTTPGCASALTRASDPTAPGAGLMWREGGEAVGLYRLLDRWVDGCPAPIVVNYRVPGSNALGREAGREPAPAPTLLRRP